MKGYLIPFVVVFLACVAGFLALDAGIMGLQGLSLIFRG